MIGVSERWRSGRRCHDMQEVRGSNTCEGVELRCLFVNSLLTIAVKSHNFTAFHREIIFKICVEKKTTFHRLSFIFFRFVLDPGTLESDKTKWHEPKLSI